MTSAEVLAAQTMVNLATERGEDVDPAILKIANARTRSTVSTGIETPASAEAALKSQDASIYLPAGVDQEIAQRMASVGERFTSTMTVHKGGREADIKDPAGLIGLGIMPGESASISTSGPDADEAFGALLTELKTIAWSGEPHR